MKALKVCMKALKNVAIELMLAKTVQLLRGAVFALEDIGAQWKVIVQLACNCWSLLQQCTDVLSSFATVGFSFVSPSLSYAQKLNGIMPKSTDSLHILVTFGSSYKFTKNQR